MPLPVAMTLGHLTRSGGESEIVRFGVSFGAPFKESGPLRSHVTTTAIGVETDQPRGLWPAGHQVQISGARLSSDSRSCWRRDPYPLNNGTPGLRHHVQAIPLGELLQVMFSEQGAKTLSKAVLGQSCGLAPTNCAHGSVGLSVGLLAG